MPSWRPAVRLAALPDGAAVRVELDGTPVCLSRVDGVPVAVRDVCAHRQIALSGGIVRDGIITCPGHFRRYDLRDGRCLNRTDRVDTFPCRTHDGVVQVLVPDPQPKQSMREFLLATARADSARLRSGEVAGSD
jgi:nitrite reductase/ring-hydroxylating ferredoxin subunit